MAQEMLRAALAGDVEAIRGLIAAGAGLGWESEDAPHPLEAALDAGHEAAFWALLEGASDGDLAFALCLAADVGAPAIVERLLARGVPPTAEDGVDLNALAYAARGEGPLEGRLTVARRLLALGADPTDALSLALARGEATMVALLRPKGKALPLDDAIVSGDVGEMRRSLGDRAPTAAEIILAARSGSGEALRLLLARTPARPEIAMNYAISGGHLDAVRFLLGAGYDPNAPTPDGGTLLSIAVINGHPALLDLLLGAGADPDADRDSEEGMTALMEAVRRDDEEMVARLLRAGADPNRGRPRLGRPLDLARRLSRDAIAVQLVAAGAEASASQD